MEIKINTFMLPHKLWLKKNQFKKQSVVITILLSDMNFNGKYNLISIIIDVGCQNGTEVIQ